MIIILYGKTAWAKRIIQENGTKWEIIDTSKSGAVSQVKSIATGHTMVLLMVNDPSFGIEYTDGE